jgi:hypothetical protein
MSQKTVLHVCRAFTMSAFAATAVGLSLSAPAWGQDTPANTSGNQPMNQNPSDALPPPTPPTWGGDVSNRAAQPQVAEQTQSLDVSRNAAYSMQQPNQDQSLIPPQAPTPGVVNQGVVNQPSVGSRAQLGIFMAPSDGPGLRVTSVTPGSAAAAAGVRAGDFLLSVGKQPVEMPGEVANIIQGHKPGDAVELRIWRDRSEQLLTANLLEMQPVQRQSTTVNRPVYSDNPVYYESNVVGGYYPTRVYRQYSYPGSYGYGYGYGPYGYRYGGPYRGSYIGTPRFGYWNSPYGEGVNVGGFQFGWR